MMIDLIKQLYQEDIEFRITPNREERKIDFYFITVNNPRRIVSQFTITREFVDVVVRPIEFINASIQKAITKLKRLRNGDD